MLRADLELYGTPPSLNTTLYAGRWPNRRLKRSWQEGITWALLAERLPRRLARVSASAVLRFPQRRARDEGNFRVLLEKALGDALVGDRRAWPEGRWLPDDTPQHYTFGAVTFSADRGSRLTIITIEYEEG